ncbi:hypothetical protein FRC17_010897 [Serendipita sp. 399]|nr:hypothetical protein FRC17_010897 [Serendipita sp. 399]
MDKQPQAPIDDAVLPRFPLTDDPDKKSSGGDGGTACDGQSAQPRSMKVAMEGDNTQVTMDLLHSVKGLYRLLEVVHEKGSGGIGSLDLLNMVDMSDAFTSLVDKFKIVQDSIARFANHVQPGSYRSQTQIDFHALDTQNIKPLGLYGSISSIVDFLYKLGRIDLEVQAFLTAPRDEQSGVTRPALRPGLYLLDANDCEPGLVFVIFWPEDGTWLDGFRSSVSRNRVTFMRYLTKLCDQIVCLVSDEHSENLIWKDNEEHRDEDDVEEPGSLDAFDRVYTFSVEQTNEEEESIATKEGFTLTHPSIRVEPVDKPELQAILQTQLIVGETAQALFQVRYVPSRTDTTEIDETMWPRALGSELSLLEVKPFNSTKIYPNLHISDTVDREGLRILLDNGLKGRLGNLEQDWQSQKTRDINKLQDDKKKQRSKELEVIKARVQTLKSSLPLYIVARILELFPILKTHRKELICAAMGRKVDQDIESDLDLESEKVATLMQNHIEIVEPKLQVIDSQIRILESHKKERYDTLKRRIRRVEDAIQNGNNLTDSDVQNLVDLIQKKKDWTEQFLAITRPDKGEGTNSVIETFTNVLNTAVETVKSTVDAVKSTVGSSTKTDKKPLPTLPALDDVTFAAIAEDLIASRPVLGDAVAELKEQMVAAFTKKLTDFKSIPHDIGKSLQDAMDSQLNEEFRNREDEEERLAWESLRQQIHAHLATQIVDGGPSFHIQHVSKETKWGYGPFRVRGTISSPTKEGLVHTIIPLETREEDSRKSAEDRSYIFRPVVRQNLPSNFMLPVTSTIKYTRLVGQDRCLMVIRDGPDYKIFLDMINHLAHTIEVGGQSRKLTLERTGEHPRFALDETKRLFAVVATHHGSLNLHVFSYDNDTNNISMRGGVTNLTKWWPSGSPTISHIVFISGMEELLLVEEGGDARIFSLLTENFRPTSIKLEGCVTAAFSSADGACLLVIINSALDDPEAKHLRIKCFHWASFGTNEGHEIEWPEGCSKTSQVSVSSVGHRYASHLLFMDVEKGHCHSLLLQITCKSSEFAFRSSRKGDVANRSSNTVNNSLIDCHAEVWTRYPVYPVIKRETTESAVHHPRVILFVSTSPATRFPPYFANLIRQFELKSRKPTKGSLKRIRINATKEWDPFLHELPVSDLQLGDWLVGLFCLIPIHLAVTGSNRFIPLKDGVQDPVFERSLLGADVAQISELISLGWYESIFSSYSAKKPVKVVTSMGEQSVGKSFALNHFVDTSFAFRLSNALYRRGTLGFASGIDSGLISWQVWLSVTPTRDYLLVAMDFEGVHSIERSAQEDTLLVLLNAAISNFVIFRNNFALSRDIAGLFTSFQSSATVLDPAVNPQLFNSTLSIIIKDVIDSDAQEIVNEFQQKFQRIVQQERGDNFISKLHKGKLDIIPWPVIESSRFYELFAALKIRLDRQAVTHHHAATFLSTLKMLMAKLKANDWGALDRMYLILITASMSLNYIPENLAIQRANQLFVHLACALAFGVIDPVNGEPLKNLETDEVLDMRSGDLELFIDSAATLVDVETYTKPQCLEKMRKRFPKLGSRYRMAETDFVELLRGYINEVIEQRINDVRNWLTTNTMRFGERPEISTLFREFDGLSRELRLAALICGSKCSSCGLLCLQDNQHKGDHDCRTSHKCGHICDFNDNHESLDVPDCGMPAGHDGRHIARDIVMMSHMHAPQWFTLVAIPVNSSRPSILMEKLSATEDVSLIANGHMTDIVAIAH